MAPIPRRVVRAIVAAALALLLVTAAAPSALANGVTGASPAPGEQLASAPAQVLLTFDHLVLIGTVSVSVSGPAGDATSGGPQVLGNDVTQPLQGGLPDGAYSVSWQINSLFEHSQGGYSFRIGPPPATATPKPKPKPKPKAKPKATPKASPTPSRTTAPPTPTPTPTSSKAPSATPTTTLAAANERPTPTITAIAAPKVQGVSYTGAGLLPSPSVLWGIIAALATVGFLVRRALRGRT